MKKIVKQIVVGILLVICILGFNVSKATNETALSQIQKYLNTDAKTVTEEQIQQVYEQLTQNYSKDELLKMLEDNEENLKSKGISDELIEAGKGILKTTDEEEIKRIIEENVSLEDIKEKVNKGYTVEEIVNGVIEEIPTTQKIEVIVDLFFANTITRVIIALIIILFMYRTILRAIIYHKAHKNPIAAFIPFYRQFVMYDICGLSFGYMILWLIPVVGWLCLCFIAIMKRIYLSKNFGKGVGFGLGLIVFPSIFQSILAFNKNIEYIYDEDDEII